MIHIKIPSLYICWPKSLSNYLFEKLKLLQSVNFLFKISKNKMSQFSRLSVCVSGCCGGWKAIWWIPVWRRVIDWFGFFPILFKQLETDFWERNLLPVISWSDINRPLLLVALFLTREDEITLHRTGSVGGHFVLPYITPRLQSLFFHFLIMRRACSVLIWLPHVTVLKICVIFCFDLFGVSSGKV